MNSTHEAIAAAIRQAGARLELPLNGDAVQRLTSYALELERWNRRINLIRFRNLDELVHRHLADGLAAALHVPTETRSLIDVGAGAGIPGAVIAAIRPDVDVMALEPIHKKHAFLRTARRRVPLPNFLPYAARLEGEDEPEGLTQRFDIAISRATWAIPQWLEKGARLVRPGGRVLAMEGRERIELSRGAARFPYESGDRQRAIIVMAVRP